MVGVEGFEPSSIGLEPIMVPGYTILPLEERYTPKRYISLKAGIKLIDICAYF